MSTNQQYSTRLGVRKNLFAISGRLDLVLTTLQKIDELYSDDHPEIAHAARSLGSAIILLQEAVVSLRANI